MLRPCLLYTSEYVQAQNDRQEEDFKKQAILLDGLYRQWISTQQKKPRVLNLKELLSLIHILRGYNYENQATILNEQGEMVPNPARLVEEQMCIRDR